MDTPILTARNLSPEYLAEDNSARMLATCISFLIIETIFVILMYASRALAREDKATIWMTLLMTAGYCTCLVKITLGILMVEIGGAGRHMPALSPPTIARMLKLSTALQIMCPLTTSLTKLGICCLYLQLLGRTSNKYRIVIKSTFALVLCILLVQVLIPFANCKPFSHTWTPSGPGSCAIPSLNLWRYLSIPNVVTTVMMIAIPIPALYKLRASSQTRLGLGLVLSVCAMAMVAAIVRFISFLEVHDFSDISYENINPFSWTVAESGLYFVAGVMLTLRPLVRKLCGSMGFDGILNTTNLSSSKSEWEKPLPPVPHVDRYSFYEVDFADDKSGRSSMEDVKYPHMSV